LISILNDTYDNIWDKLKGDSTTTSINNNWSFDNRVYDLNSSLETRIKNDMSSATTDIISAISNSKTLLKSLIDYDILVTSKDLKKELIDSQKTLLDLKTNVDKYRFDTQIGIRQFDNDVQRLIDDRSRDLISK